MCGRYVLTTPPEQIASLFEIAGAMPRDWKPRYNIAPTQAVAVVRAGDGGRVLEMMRWGLVARWAKSLDTGPPLIMARSETAAQKPAFREAMKQAPGGGRCLIPCDGFYEWKVVGEKAKQPMFIQLRGRRPFALAGLWERWTPPEGEPLHSCTILTIEANEFMKPIHDRMPVIVPGDLWRVWLDPAVTQVQDVANVLRPIAPDALEAHPVGRAVNRVGTDGPSLIERVDENKPPDTLW